MDRKRMPGVIASILSGLCAIWAGCGPEENPQFEKPAADRGGIARASGVRAGDGISEFEAEKIAKYYFHSFLEIDCGEVGQVRSGEGVWFVSTRIGFAGAPAGDIRIDKTTGAVSWPEKDSALSFDPNRESAGGEDQARNPPR